MILQKILTIMTLPSVLPYHFYNPLTREVLSQSSINSIPTGYRLLLAPKNNTRTTKRNRGDVSGACTDAGFTCTSRYKKFQTFQFECDYDSQCPAFYKCCPQRCFVHKICSKISIKELPNGNNIYERPGTCERWPYSCQTPYHHSFTSMFRCNSDKQCPIGFKCCEQSCFSHRICSRVTSTNITGLLRQPTQPIVGVDKTKTMISYGATQDSIEESVLIESPSAPVDFITDDHFAKIDTKTPQLTVEDEINENEFYEEVSTTTDQELTTAVSTTLQDFDLITSSELNLTVVNTLSKIQSNRANISIKKTMLGTTTTDSNAIIPEYSAYYYHYGEDNDTEYDDEDYDEEDE